MRTALAFAACLAWPGAAPAQPLLDDYARATALVSYMTVYVGETLLACAAAKALTEAQADARFKSYRERNAVLLERAEAWSRQAEQRLRALGEELAAKHLSEQASLSAMAEALRRVRDEIGAARDVPALCAARIVAIDTGHYDVSGNPELLNLLQR